MKSNRKSTVLMIVFFLLGLGIVLYPTIANKWNEYRSSKLTVSYDRTVGEVDRTYLKEEMEKAIAYNDALVPKSVPDAFAVRDGLSDPEYESLLNLNGDGMMGYVIIPVIDVKVPIYHYTSDETLEKGAGHLLGSSLPVGGEGTHSVISAHRGLPGKKLFTDLNLVEEGDHFMIEILGETLTYEVDQILVVEPHETESLAPEDGRDYVTLMTCTPYGVNSHRILVRGHRVANEEVEEAEIENETADLGRQLANNKISILIRVLCILAGILLAWIGVSAYTRWSDRKNQNTVEKNGLEENGSEEKEMNENNLHQKKTSHSRTAVRNSNRRQKKKKRGKRHDDFRIW